METTIISNDNEIMSSNELINKEFSSTSRAPMGDEETFTFRDYGKAVYSSAKTFYDKADLGTAYELFEKSLSLTKFPSDGFVALKIYGFLIKICAERNNDHLVNKWLEESSKYLDVFAKEIGSLNAEFLFNQGILRGYVNDHVGAQKILKLAYDKASQENDGQVLSKVLLALAYNSFNLKSYKNAEKYLVQLEEVLHILNKTYLKGAMYLFWGRLHAHLNNYENSLMMLEKAGLQLKEKKCWNLLGYLLLTRGQVYKKMGDYENALLIFNLAKNITDPSSFKKLSSLLEQEITEVNDNSIDLYLDRGNRKIIEKNIGVIDFKHRFILLEILFLLAKNSGNFYDKHALAQEVWQDDYNPLIHDKLIYTSVSRLRKLIEPKKGQEKRKYIIRGKDGYTFNPNVKIRFQNSSSTENITKVSTFEITSPL